MQPDNYYGDGIELTPTILRALKKNGWEIIQTSNSPSVLISKKESSNSEHRITVSRYIHLPREVRHDAEHPYENSTDFRKALNKYMNCGAGRRLTAPISPDIMKVWLLDENVCRILNEVIHGHTCLNTEAFERLMQYNTESRRLFKLTPNPEEAVYVYTVELATASRATLLDGIQIDVLYAWEMQQLANSMQDLLTAPYSPETNTGKEDSN